MEGIGKTLTKNENAAESTILKNFLGINIRIKKQRQESQIEIFPTYWCSACEEESLVFFTHQN